MFTLKVENPEGEHIVTKHYPNASRTVEAIWLARNHYTHLNQKVSLSMVDSQERLIIKVEVPQS